MNKKIEFIFIIIAVGFIVLIVLALAINHYVEVYSSKYIVNANDVPKADAVLILGAYVYPNGLVSPMLKDRLLTGYDLYKAGKSQKLLVSGDHGQKDYDEVNTMKLFLENKGVSSSDIFMDHAGFNTYNSMYRAKDIFEVKKIIIVTQEYHLKRAVFIARQLGLEAYGVASDRQNYGAVMIKYKLREILARDKDFFTAKILKPKPTYLGETIPVSGDGNETNDK